MASSEASLGRLLQAAAFAARAHRNQWRKDGQTPYVSHVFRVCLTVRQLFGVDDDDVLTAALLHDTIEDTDTDFDDIESAVRVRNGGMGQGADQGEAGARAGSRRSTT